MSSGVRSTVCLKRLRVGLCVNTCCGLLCGRSGRGRVLLRHRAAKPEEGLGAKAVRSLRHFLRAELPCIGHFDGCQNANHSPEVLVSARSSRPDGRSRASLSDYAASAVSESEAQRGIDCSRQSCQSGCAWVDSRSTRGEGASRRMSQHGP